MLGSCPGLRCHMASLIGRLWTSEAGCIVVCGISTRYRRHTPLRAMLVESGAGGPGPGYLRECSSEFARGPRAEGSVSSGVSGRFFLNPVFLFVRWPGTLQRNRCLLVVHTTQTARAIEGHAGRMGRLMAWYGVSARLFLGTCSQPQCRGECFVRFLWAFLSESSDTAHARSL